ncbi:hypothetical protein AYO20_11420 [Fonsecaea nubica]|uniref:ABM domain-containing protein n=1 Tax=Fonsecaea nubica TaxID=856822 RepID=A0A178BVG8_9EURO|nr:hypothetical protein AYO20_11420 [Fonsecaea nubica]OAL21164.1 hypothetical protein AYO20_11420 [Fonsecaea nubica]
MSNAPVPPNVMVQVCAKPGKEKRVEELIATVADQVRQHEPWVSLYRYYRAKHAGSSSEEEGVEYIIVFRLDDMSKLQTRRDLPHHQEIARAIREEDLLRTPLKYTELGDMGFWKR